MVKSDLTRVFKSEGESLNAIDQFPGDGHTILYCTSDEVIATWDSRVPGEAGMTKFAFKGENPRDVQANPSDGSEFIVGDTKGRLVVASCDQHYDVRNPSQHVYWKNGAHGADIVQVRWHPTDRDLLLSASKDKYFNVKLWSISQLESQPLRCFTNIDSPGKLRWIPSQSAVKRFGVGSLKADCPLYLWDINEANIPCTSFKVEEFKMTDFCFTPDKIVYSNANSTVFVRDFDQMYRVVDERRARPLCCDIYENFAFVCQDDSLSSISKSSGGQGQQSPGKLELTSKVTNKKVHFMNVSEFNSLYEQVPALNKFASMAEEIEFFIERYVVDAENPIQSLQTNAEVCREAGKTELSEVWLSLKEVLKLYQATPEALADHKPVSDNRSSVEKLLSYYKENPEKFEVDLKNQKIKIPVKGSGQSEKDQDIQVLVEYEERLAEDIRSEQNQQRHEISQFEQMTVNQRSQTIIESITEVIDNGEFIHGYYIFLCLESLVTNLDPKVEKVWRKNYIDMLITMGFYNQAAKSIKHSKQHHFAINTEMLERFLPRCTDCKASLEKYKGGKCSKCQNTVDCGICQMPIRGLQLWCQICGHGGHFREMKNWFSHKDAHCPTGCGHLCFRFY